MEKGETLQKCLQRELVEEMRLDISVGEHFADSEYTYDFGTIVLHAFWASCKSQHIPAVLEHEQYKWVKLNELADYDFAPADKPIIDAIMKISGK